MSLKERLVADLTNAMKSKDTQRLGVLRMLKAKILETEVSLREEKGRDYQLEDTEVLRVLTSYAKQRRESIDQYRQGGREDLALQEEAELAVVQDYLPRALSEDEVREVVKGVIAELGATSKKEMGAVMKAATGKLAGAADGKLVSRIVGEMLGSL